MWSLGRDCFVSDIQIRQGKILHARGSNRSNGVIECNWRKFRKEVERFLQLFIADRTSGWMGWVLETLISSIKEGDEILAVKLFSCNMLGVSKDISINTKLTEVTDSSFHPMRGKVVNN